ncbi:MAG: hypothetical protein JRK53_20080 [Deltaproteobacteria bacterium]|nr:hypothetical protein [Deltaproteobacteria bacterium]
MKVGIYRFHEILDEGFLTSLELKYRTPIHILSVYRAWNRCKIKDDLPWLERLKRSPRDILLTWEPWQVSSNNPKPYDQPAFSLRNILSGRYDCYICAFAKALKEFPRGIYLRPMHEMNGNWYPWCGTVNGNTVESFALAWRHIQNLVAAETESQVSWVWSPYARSYPDDRSNSIEDYFPGDSAVDWIGLDGYNWGKSADTSTWQSFEEIFSDSYATATRISRRPIMIAETACAEAGGNKAQWITNACQALKMRFQRIEILIWFDHNKERNWEIASSAAALGAFQGFADPHS